jgi:hypothetical protein
MPVVVCSSCSAKLNLPDRLIGSGKTVRCPKCMTAVETSAAAPAPQPVAAAAPAPAATPRPRPRPPAEPAELPPADEPSRRTRHAEPDGVRYDELEIVEPASDWDGYAMLHERRLLVKRRVLKNLIKINVDIQHPETKEVFGTANEKTGTGMAMVRNLKLGPVPLKYFFPYRVEVREKDGEEPFLTLRWRVMPLAFLIKVEVLDRDEQMIGYFQQKLFSLMGGFWVYDTADEQIAEVKFKFGKMPRYNFVSADGRELGYVTVEGLAEMMDKPGKFKARVVWGTPGLSVTIDPAAQGDTKLMVLLLATVLAMELQGVADKLK